MLLNLENNRYPKVLLEQCVNSTVQVLVLSNYQKFCGPILFNHLIYYSCPVQYKNRQHKIRKFYFFCPMEG